MIIDIHTHVWPEKVVEKAREYLEKTFRTRTVALPTVANLLRYMDKNGVEASAVCSVASRANQVDPINAWLFGEAGPRIKVFASMHPGYRAQDEMFKRIRDNASGIKLQPEFQEFYVDDEAAFPMYERMQEYGLPVLFHCGEELSGTMVVRSSPERMLRVHRRFPAMKIICAHFGGFRLWKDVEKYLVGTDVYFDLSFTFGYLDDASVLRMLAGHSRDKVMFGSDFPLIDPKKDIDHIASLPLEQGFKDKILGGNAAGLLGIN